VRAQPQESISGLNRRRELLRQGVSACLITNALGQSQKELPKEWASVDLLPQRQNRLDLAHLENAVGNGNVGQHRKKSAVTLHAECRNHWPQFLEPRPREGQVEILPRVWHKATECSLDCLDLLISHMAIGSGNEHAAGEPSGVQLRSRRFLPAGKRGIGCLDP
jgi:hypothetical protein